MINVEIEEKAAAFVKFAFNFYGAALGFNKIFSYGKAQAGAGSFIARSGYAEIPFKYARQVFFINTLAAILYRKADAVTAYFFYVEGNS